MPWCRALRDYRRLVRMPGDDPQLVSASPAPCATPMAATRSASSVEFVGPAVGEELRDQGGLGMLLALGGIPFTWHSASSGSSACAVLSLFHDVIVVLGVFSFFQISFDLTVLAAVLAVIGYSLNDTIVIFDRIRENFRMLRAELLRTSTSPPPRRCWWHHGHLGIYLAGSGALMVFGARTFGASLWRCWWVWA